MKLNDKKKSDYSIVRTERNSIKIVEIKEKNCSCYDFVLIYYNAAAENIPFLEKLHEKYKVSEKTLCFIGCISDDSDFKSDFSKYYRFFDLNATMITEGDFEAIVLSCYSCRGGITHGDPQDWLNLKSSGNLLCLEETGTSVSKMTDNLYSRFKKHFTEQPDSKRIKNGIVSIIANDLNEISMGDIDSIRKLSEFFKDEYSLALNLNTECDVIEPGTLKIIFTGFV